MPGHIIDIIMGGGAMSLPGAPSVSDATEPWVTTVGLTYSARFTLRLSRNDELLLRKCRTLRGVLDSDS